MNKDLIKNTFREFKKISGIDYAITYPDNLGDCQSCVNYALCEKYGEDSKGIFLKHWSKGMNKGGSFENLESVYIAHDLTEEQGQKFIDYFSEHFEVFPKKYDSYRCFELFEKDSILYEVSYYDKDTKFSDIGTEKEALRRLNYLFLQGLKPKMERIV